MADLTGSRLTPSGAQKHSFLGNGKNFHGPHRQSYSRISCLVLEPDEKGTLCVAFNAMDDTMDEHNLVLSSLEFGVVPRFEIINTGLPTLKDHMEALKLPKLK